MKLTREHAEYWRQRTAPAPAWAASFLPVHRVDIDSVVNAHAGPRPRTDSETHNTLALLRMARRRIGKHSYVGAPIESLHQYLTGLAAAHAGIMGPVPKRIALARKWARRIQKGNKA